MLPFPNYDISTPIMSEKKNIISNNSKRRKKRWPPTVFTRGGGGDELATVKAAAWAWYQRNEGKPMVREFDLTTRATRTSQPSRYKLEAKKNMIVCDTRVSNPYTNRFLRGDQETKSSSLLDPYEIKCISKRISDGSLLADRTTVFRHDHGHHYDHVLLQKKLEYGSKKENELLKQVSNRNFWKRMNLLAPRTVCGRSDDVDRGAYQVGPRTLKVGPTSVNTRTGYY